MKKFNTIDAIDVIILVKRADDDTKSEGIKMKITTLT